MLISLSRRKPLRDAAAAAYARIVEQARQPVFFTVYGVPDTLDGRFELICLHAFCYLHRIKAERPRSTALSQALFDTMFADLDRSMRELGVGDLSVGKHVKRMARGFYGRIRAYQDGIEGSDETLGAALTRNLYGTRRQSAAAIAATTGYVRRAVAELARQAATELLCGRIRFPAPGIAEPADEHTASGAA
ncbi:MAG TPA: ubiquinol-cytochrome C chaperone family protein [Stellaceae bacterium]|jgi:cytochrome b pre-mRNA-processing protein 3